MRFYKALTSVVLCFALTLASPLQPLLFADTVEMVGGPSTGIDTPFDFSDMGGLLEDLAVVPVEDVVVDDSEWVDGGTFSFEDFKQSAYAFGSVPTTTEFTCFGDELWLIDSQVFGIDTTIYGEMSRDAYDVMHADISKGAGSELLNTRPLTVLAFSGAESWSDALLQEVINVLTFSALDTLTRDMAADVGYEQAGRYRWGISYTTYPYVVVNLTLHYLNDTSYAPRAELENRARTMASTIVNNTIGMTDRQKVYYFAQWLADNNTYNYPAANGGSYDGYGSHQPWSYVSALLSRWDASIVGPVCEGYSRALDLLCELADVPCILVTGDNHMWNNVYLEGKWWGVDVTWADQDTSQLQSKYMFSTTLNGDYGHVVEPFKYLTVPVPALGVPAIHPEYGIHPGDPAKIEPFVRRFYKNIMGRDASMDPAGLNYWTQALSTGRQSACDVLTFFLNCPEYLNRKRTDNEFATDMYTTIFDRAPDASGFAYWVDENLAKGITRNHVAAMFASTGEFAKLCEDAGISVGTYKLTKASEQNVGLTKFLANIYVKALGRPFDADGVEYWAGEVLAGRRAPADAARAFIFSDEFTSKGYDDTAYLKVMYRTFFGREYDDAGLNYWLGQMQSGTTRAQVLDAFAYSTEFVKVMAEFGI